VPFPCHFFLSRHLVPQPGTSHALQSVAYCMRHSTLHSGRATAPAPIIFPASAPSSLWPLRQRPLRLNFHGLCAFISVAPAPPASAP
jgi:hypothetical protein